MVTLKELRQDFQAWCKWKNIPSGITSFLILFFKYAEYRRLVDFRLKSGGLGWMRIFTYPTSYHLNLYIVCKKIKTCLKGAEFTIMIKNDVSDVKQE